MTAEIAVMNKVAVALAADSAASVRTPSGTKVYAANKLFRLSHGLPVGVLVYGSSEFMGVPWEVLIKEYRASLRGASKPRLDDYYEGFMNFLTAQNWLEQEDYAKRIVLNDVLSYTKWLVDKMDFHLQQEIGRALSGATEHVTQQSLNSLLQETLASLKPQMLKVIDDEKKKLSGLPMFDGFTDDTERQFQGDYKDDVERIVKLALDESNLVKALPDLDEFKASLMDVAVFPITRQPPVELASGLVFAGFGSSDYFPSTRTVSFRGMLGGKIQRKIDHQRSLSVTRDNGATVIGFAQDDMIRTFMHGADPDLQNSWWNNFRAFLRQVPVEVERALEGSAVNGADVIVGALKGYLETAGEALLQKAMEGQKQDHTVPFIQSVSFLSKDEMAELAESLIRLTSLKRRVTMSEETVGGPIDVAVISRREGFVYVKRKHYFDIELNPHYTRTTSERSHETEAPKQDGRKARAGTRRKQG